MEIESLYNLAEKENIYLFDTDIKDSSAMLCSDGNINAIAIDYSKIKTSTEEKCVLAEELGHYYCNATYSLSCIDEVLINKAEYRAKKWAAKALISPSDLKKAKLLGLKYKWELAEFFGVTECIAEKAVNYIVD